MRLVILFATTALILIGCGKQDDEEQINHNMAAMEQAVEARDFSAIEKYLHSSFVANERMDVDEVRQLLRFYSLRHKDIDVTIVSSTTTMHADLPDRASTVISVITTGSSGLIPSNASVRRVEAQWIKDSGEWLITTATWRR